ncbi:MAG: HEAT repeat domain-containing protein [Myxococcota bacterium]|nr:HEAT repeat domain-containing protein [Myxococcota bacterium]
MTAKQIIEEMFGLDERMAQLAEKFEGCPQPEREKALVELFEGVAASLSADAELPLRAPRVVDLLASQEGDAAVKILGNGLGHVNSALRHLCAEGLIHCSADGLEVILPAVEMALTQGGTAAEEMAFLLAEIDDSKVTRQLVRFLKSNEAEVVAAAIESLAEVGDESCLPELERLRKDKRKVKVAEETAEEWTIGQLAEDAIEMFNQENEEE